jgi:protease-4
MKDLIRSIINIFRWVGKILTAFRILTLNIAFLLLLFFIFTALTLQSPKTESTVSNKGALLLSLSGDIVEEKETIDPLSTLINDKLGFDNAPKETLFQDILDAIKTAATDHKVTCILLDFSNLGSVGLDQLQIIGKSLTDFKKSGKKVIAAEDFYSQKAYYLASYADEIYLNPMGGVDLHGIGTFRLYFKDAIDTLKINYNIFRVGTFKSALEPIMRNSMSPDAKTQNMSWLSVLWENISGDIIRERKLNGDVLKTYTENIASELATAGGDTAQLAVDTGLVDGLKTRAELREYLTTVAGEDREGDFQQISLSQYLKTIPHSYQSNGLEEPSVGIIIAQGPILNGDQPIGTIGGDSLAEMIREAREDININALVLRVVSGGGSVFASEIIRQEILEFKKTGKPFVISMGTMAASGGYWIAADADEIWASPVTLTGSIGIFAAIPTFEDSLANMGIYNDGVGTTSLASSLNLTRPMPPLLKESITITLRHGYEQFLDIVSKGRAMKRAQVSEIAQGRVFDGQTAQTIGLVDKLGTMDDAIQSAASLAGLDEYSARYIRKPLSVKDEILSFFSVKATNWLSSAAIPQPLLSVLNSLITPIREIMLFDDPKGLYAHCMIHDLSL